MTETATSAHRKEYNPIRGKRCAKRGASARAGASTMELVCGDCGPQQVAPAIVRVHANRRTGFALSAFPCPSCGELVTGGNPDLIAQLLEAGARRYELRSLDAPPLCPDDLLDFHELLRSDEALAEWLGTPDQTGP